MYPYRLLGHVDVTRLAAIAEARGERKGHNSPSSYQDQFCISSQFDEEMLGEWYFGKILFVIVT